MSAAGWFADPSGRFGQRWWDGTSWSEHVVSAAGSVITDPLPESGPPFAPPADPPRAEPAGDPFPADGAPQDTADDATTLKRPAGLDDALTGSPRQQEPWQPAPQQPPQQQPWRSQGGAPGYGPQGYPPVAGPPYSSRARYAPGPGLAVAAVGLVLVALSLFGLKWADADKGSFLDISSAFRDAGSHAADDVITYAYVAWAGFVLLALTAVLALVSGLPLPRTDNSYGRIACAFVAGLALVLQVWSIEQLFPSDVDPEIGAWLGAVGYLLVVVGAVIGAQRAAPVAAYPPAYPPAGYPAHH